MFGWSLLCRMFGEICLFRCVDRVLVNFLMLWGYFCVVLYSVLCLFILEYKWVMVNFF